MVKSKKGVVVSGTVNIILLGIVSFLNDVSSEMIMPILPMFLTALGGTGIIIGFIGGLRSSWADKLGKRKPFASSGYVLCNPL